jgi:hypothetical protein
MNHRVKSDFEYHWDQETASRSNEKTWQTEETRHRSEIILDWRKSIFWMNNIWTKTKQEIEQQSIESFKIVKTLRN